jgi:hypothetical protein
VLEPASVATAIAVPVTVNPVFLPLAPGDAFFCAMNCSCFLERQRSDMIPDAPTTTKISPVCQFPNTSWEK